LTDRSHRPGSCPHQMDPAVEVAVLEARRRHPGWGPRRIVHEVAKAGHVSSESGVYRALRRSGLIEPGVLKDMRASDHVLVLLYWAGRLGTSMDDLTAWVPPAMRANLRRTVRQLHDRHLVHFEDAHARLTGPGEGFVAERKLITPI